MTDSKRIQDDDSILLNFNAYWNTPLNSAIEDFLDNKPFASHWLSIRCNNQEDWSAFTRHCRNLMKQHESKEDNLSARDLNLLGIFHNYIGKPQEAKNYFLKAIDKTTNKNESDIAKIELAYLYKNSQPPKDHLARQYLKEATPGPNVTAMHYLITNRDSDKSDEALRKAKEAEDPKALLYEGAESNLVMLAKKGHPTALRKLAEAIALTHPTKAIAYLEAAHKKGDKKALFSLANVYRQLEKYEDALNCYKEADKNNYADAKIELAYFYVEQGQFDEAYNLFKTEGNSAYEAWVAVGNACKKMGSLEYASICYAKFDVMNYESTEKGEKQKSNDLNLKNKVQADLSQELFKTSLYLSRSDEERAGFYLRLSLQNDPDGTLSYTKNDARARFGGDEISAYRYTNNIKNLKGLAWDIGAGRESNYHIIYHGACAFMSAPANSELDNLGEKKSPYGLLGDIVKKEFIKFATNKESQDMFIEIYLKNPDTWEISQKILGDKYSILDEAIQKKTAYYEKNHDNIVNETFIQLKQKTEEYLDHLNKELKKLGPEEGENKDALIEKLRVAKDLSVVLVRDDTKNPSTDEKIQRIMHFQVILKKGKETLEKFRTFGLLDDFRGFFNTLSAAIFPIALTRMLVNWVRKGTVKYWESTGEQFLANTVATASNANKSRLFTQSKSLTELKNLSENSDTSKHEKLKKQR